MIIKSLLYYKEFFLGLVLTLTLLWPLFANPYFSHHDDVQVIRLFEMDKCFKDGQIPCRWVPDLGGLYGYPLFNYYAPLPYYFGEMILYFTKSLTISVKVMFGLSFIGAYIFMFFLARKFWGNMGATLSGIFYSFAPYHAVDFYVRGAMGEMWGLMFFPAILWAFVRLSQKVNLLNMILSSLFVGLLIISHNLSAMMLGPVLIGWILFLFFKVRQIKFLWISLLSLVLGIILSSFYLFPAIFEKNLVHVETTTYGYFSYTEHFKGFKKLFLERNWGYGASVREVPGGEKDGLSFQIGWIHILGWVLALFSGYKLWRKQKFLSMTIIFSSAVIALSVFLVNPRSQFVWDLVEPMKFFQFPWRLLMLVIFFISFISGSFFIPEKRKIIWAGLIVMVVVFNFSYFKPEKFLIVNDAELLSGENWDRQIKRSIFDYLPIYAKEPPAELAKERYEILTGDSRIDNFREGTNWFNFETDTKSHTIIRISQYYFPDWTIFVDGKKINVEYTNNSLGLMTIILGEGKHTVEGRLYDTPVRSIANIITVTAVFIMLFLYIIQLSGIKEWIRYYRKRIN